MFRHRSFWIILLLTAIVWLVAAMSEDSDHALTVRVEWGGFDAARYVVVQADTLLPVSVNTNAFQAMSLQRTLNNKPYQLLVKSDTVMKVNSLLLDDIVKQTGMSGVKGISSPVETVGIKLTERQRKAYLPILRNVEFHYAGQRGLSGTPLVEPDTVWLYGDSASLARIPSVYTADTVVRYISDSGWYSLALEPVWEQYRGVRPSVDSLRVFLPVGKFVEKTVSVTVKPRCESSGSQLRVIPERVSVTLWTPVEDYDHLTADQVEAVVVYTPDVKEKELPVLITRFPSNMRIKHISPSSLQYVVIKKQ